MTYTVNAQTLLNKGLNLLIYGLQGSGKTYLAGTAQDHPAMKRTLFLNIEGGLITVGSRGDILAEDIRSVEDLEKCFWRLHRKEQDKEWKDVRTVVIDSLTELQGINLEEIAKKRNRVDDLQLQDYKVSTMHLKRILRWYRDLPVNLVLTALVHKQYPAGTDGIVGDPVEIRPALTQKLSDAIMGFCDAVWYLHTAEEKTADGKDTRVARYMLTRDRGPYRAKTRGVRFAEALGGRVKDPTLPALYDLFVETESATQ